METHDIAYDYVDVDLLDGEKREEIRREKNSICPGCGYPIIIVDGTLIRGYDEPRLREVLGV
jgi:glutaredoxin